MAELLVDCFALLGDGPAAAFAPLLVADFAVQAKCYAVGCIFVLTVGSVAGYAAVGAAAAGACLLAVHKHSVCHALHPPGSATDQALIL